MAVQGSGGQSWVGRIAGVIVLVVLVIGGYFALRPAAKIEQTIDVAVVPPAAGGKAAAPTAEPAAIPPSAAASAPPASAPSAATPTAPSPADQAVSVAPAPAAQSGQAALPAAPSDQPAASSVPAATAGAPAQSPESAKAGEPVAPSFDVVRVEPRGDTVVAGLAPPHSKVEVLDGAAPIAKGEANERGEFALTADQPLAPGPHDLSIRSTSPDGRTEILSEQSVAVNVPDNPKEGPLVVLNTPEGASKVIQVPEAQKTAAAGAAVEPKPDVTVDAVEFQDGKLYISGSAAIGGTVRVYVDGVIVGDVAVDADGRWVIEADRAVDPGQHTIRADRIEQATGNVIARSEVPFEQNGDVATLMAVKTEGGGSAGASSTGDVPSPKSVIIRHGDNLWTISKRLYGHGVRFSTIYEANNDQIRDPDLIYPGQVFLLPAGDARWKP